MVGGGGNDGVVSSSLCTIAIIHAQLLLLIVLLLSGRTRSNTHTHTFLELISSGGLSVGLCVEARSGRIGSDRIGARQRRRWLRCPVHPAPFQEEIQTRNSNCARLGSARLDSQRTHALRRKAAQSRRSARERNGHIHTYIYI